MQMQEFKNFLREITTFKTVWIDRGQGRWVTKKRMHPVLRLICVVVAIFVCGIAYASYSSFFVNSSSSSKQASRESLTFSLQEPPAEMPMPKAKIENHVENRVMNPVLVSQSPVVENANLEIRVEKVNKVNPESSSSENAQKIFAGVKNDNNYRIFVNKSEYKLTLYKGDKIVKVYPIAIGRNTGDKQYIGDHRTPVGNFKIVSIEDASKWSHDFRDGKGKIKGAYGPWFLRLDAKGWKGIGIHGTHDPDSLGTRATEGCVRLRNSDIQELRQLAYVNMPVVISER